MNVKVVPRKLSGKVDVISSKSLSHRYVIASGLAQGISTIHHVLDSDDLDATKEALSHFGVTFHSNQIIGHPFVYDGQPIDCKESGSTLRFMIPLAMLQNEEVTFTGKGRLPDRPLGVYEDIFKTKISFPSQKSLPCLVKGPLCGGEYALRGDVSSQFITGLLFALPLVKENSVITWTTPLSSKGYIDLTIDVLKQYGIRINEFHDRFEIDGNQVYQPLHTTVEGDFSQAAFWIVAGLLGGPIALSNLNPTSKQGDAAIISIIKDMGGQINYLSDEKIYQIIPSQTHGITIDLTDIPDLGPILMVLAAFSKGKTHFKAVSRLKMKESDRLDAMYRALTLCGVKMMIQDDEAWIEGQPSIDGNIKLDGASDHRIVMALSIMAIKAKHPITITHAKAIQKSYPTFFNMYQSLGGVVSELK